MLARLARRRRRWRRRGRARGSGRGRDTRDLARGLKAALQPTPDLAVLLGRQLRRSSFKRPRSALPVPHKVARLVATVAHLTCAVDELLEDQLLSGSEKAAWASNSASDTVDSDPPHEHER
jgi:hypothetical protein